VNKQAIESSQSAARVHYFNSKKKGKEISRRSKSCHQLFTT
jgi:hypothetical protein